MAQLAIRPLRPTDIDEIVRYFCDASSQDIERMGLDTSRFLDAGSMRSALLMNALTPVGQGTSCYLIWEVDGEAIGHCSLKDIRPGEGGGMHLHMWRKAARGRGFGGELFCRSAIEFFRLYDLPRIVCEPRSANPLPNRMLQKVGFPLLRTYVGRSSELSAETELNCYDIKPEIALSYIKARPNSSTL